MAARGSVHEASFVVLKASEDLRGVVRISAAVPKLEAARDVNLGCGQQKSLGRVALS